MPGTKCGSNTKRVTAPKCGAYDDAVALQDGARRDGWMLDHGDHGRLYGAKV